MPTPLDNTTAIPNPGQVVINPQGATSIAIGGGGVPLVAPGGGQVPAGGSYDTSAAGALSIGPVNANILHLGHAGCLVDFAYPVVALGGGAAPTVGTIGGAGPAVAGQNSWLEVDVGGVASFIPLWR